MLAWPASTSFGTPFALDVNQWHTYWTLYTGGFQQAALDGVLRGNATNLGISLQADTPSSLFGCMAHGAITFRNLKAWRIPVPVLT